MDQRAGPAASIQARSPARTCMAQPPGTDRFRSRVVAALAKQGRFPGFMRVRSQAKIHGSNLKGARYGFGRPTQQPKYPEASIDGIHDRIG
jgi:hypothetical protein